MKTIHKTLMASGLWLLVAAARGQETASFSPADFGGRPITVPIQGAAYRPFPDGEFSFDCKIWLKDLAGPQPIFSKDNYEGVGFLAFFVTEQGELAFRYTVGTAPEGKYEGHRNLAISEKDAVKPGQWVPVAMAHTPVKTRFWVNNRPVKSHFSADSRPGKALFDNEPWLLGGVRMSPKGLPSPFGGRLDDMRFWRGDLTALYSSRPGGRPVPESYGDLLLAEYDMEGLDPSTGGQVERVTNRSNAPDGFLNGKIAGGDQPVDVEKLLKGLEKQRTLAENKEKTPPLVDMPGWLAMVMIGVFVVFIFLWVIKTSPGATYFSNPKTGAGEAAHDEAHLELPIEFGQLWPGERLEFVVHSGSPLPWWRLAIIGGQVAFGLFILRGLFAEAFARVLSDNEPEQMAGIFKIVFMLGVMLAFLWYLNREHWGQVGQLFRGKRTVVGTSERLILGNPGGANRTVFWEQVRSVERDAVAAAQKFELRSGPMPIESFMPEIFWLTQLDRPEEVFQRSKRLMAARPVARTGEGDLNFHPKMTDGGPEAWFGPCEVHQTLLFAAHDFFGKNQLLMLRSRIKGATVEPYDIPKPGWAVVLFLEEGARFPLFFTEDLAEAKRAAACFRERKT